MIWIVLVSVVVLGALVCVFISMQPSRFRVERSTSISAPAMDCFARVQDFHEWQHWSPWAKLDPSMRMDYSGNASGAGAVYHWSGNNKVGEGRMTIIECHPPERLEIRLEFVRPFRATNIACFSFSPKGGCTTVTWTMTGEANFFTKAIGLFFTMDRMIGGDFEKGLASLKKLLEKG